MGKALLIQSASPVGLFCEMWSLRGFVHSGSACCLSRQRHGAGMNQMRLHHHATAVVCGSCASIKNPCRTKPPAPAFSLPHTTLSARVRCCRYREDLQQDEDSVVEYLKGNWLGRSWVNISHELTNAIAGQMR